MAKAKSKKSKVKATVLNNKSVRPKAQGLDVYNLNTKEEVSAFLSLVEQEDSTPWENYHAACQIERFLKTGEESPLRWGQLQVLLDDEAFILFDGTCFWSTAALGSYVGYPDFHQPVLEPTLEKAEAVLIYCDKRTKANSGWEHMVITKADDGEDGNILVESLTNYQCPAVSFLALSDIVTGKPASGVPTLLQKIADQKVWLVDFEPDRNVDLSDEEKKVRRSKKGSRRLKPPQPGYTLVGTHWHRSGTALFYDDTTNKGFLLGQDEDQYFAVELPEPANSIVQAHRILQPKAVRGRSDWKRQGEWFALPVDEKDVPEEKDCLMVHAGDSQWDVDDCALIMARDDPSSNRHGVCSTEIRFTAKGIFIHNLSLRHNQHGAMDMDGWCQLHRNTAVRSVSQEGVD